MQFSNQQVAHIFRDIADSMEVLGENRFKYQAYSRAADTIDALPTSLYEYLETGTLDDIPGVGPAISAKITELLTTGQMQFRERLREQVPDGVLDIMRVPGVGPKTALRLYRELNIHDRNALGDAARTGQIRSLKGLGQKLETRILEALAAPADDAPARFLLGEMLPLARELVAALQRACPNAAEITYAGSLRRGAPTIGDIDLLAAGDPQIVLNAFAALPQVASVDQISAQRSDAVLHNGKPCTLFVVDPQVWGTALALWTASTAHRQRLFDRAHGRGIALPSTSATTSDGLPAAPNEAAFYDLIGLPLIPPELREDRGEIAAAEAGRLPELIELADLQADMHTHSTWSDGRGSIAEMAETARARGYSHYVVTDHSHYMGIVNGLDPARLKQQRAEIDALNAEFARQKLVFRLLQGIEVDILPDGSLALPDEALATLDWVVASPHVGLRQDRATITQRLLNAIRNPHVDCIGHPTGRKLLTRAGADLDMDQILAAAAETGTVLEVDGAYERLDLDSEYVQRAIGMGIRIAIDSDAHHPRDLAGIEYGVLTARRGWAQATDVVNCWSWEQINEQL